MPMLAPSPKFRAVGTDGLALVGGKLYTYTAGTSTPKDSYTNFGAGTANTNPVILDARGEADVWLQGSYKLVLKDSLDQSIWTVDDIRDLTSDQTFTNATLAGTLSITGGTITWAANNTHSGNHTFSANVAFNGTTTIGNASSDAFTVNSNTVTWTNGATHSGDHTYSGDVTVSGDLNNASGPIIPGTYSATITAVANCTVTTPATLHYSRNGDQVVVSGSIAVNPTSASTLTQVGISLPVASNVAANSINGTAASLHSAPAVVPGYIVADSTNDRAQLEFINDTDIGDNGWTFIFMYRIAA